MSSGWLYGLLVGHGNRLIASALVVLALAAAMPAAPARAEDRALVGLESVTDDSDYCARIQTAFTNESFAELDAIAERARPLAKRFPDGRPELQVFYDSFVKDSCSHTYTWLPDNIARERASIAEHWVDKISDSATARIVIATICYELAWDGRGSGFAKDVSPDQWELYRSRLQQVAQFMRGVDPDRDA